MLITGLPLYIPKSSVCFIFAETPSRSSPSFPRALLAQTLIFDLSSPFCVIDLSSSIGLSASSSIRRHRSGSPPPLLAGVHRSIHHPVHRCPFLLHGLIIWVASVFFKEVVSKLVGSDNA